MELETHGRGVPVILIGGGNSGLRAFAGQNGLAEQGYLLIAPAPRTQLPERADFEADAASVDAVLPPEPAHVVGHSVGGLTAMFLAARRPTGVRSLLLVEPAAMSIARGVEAVEQHVKAVGAVFDRAEAMTIEEFDAAVADAFGFPPRESGSLSSTDRFRLKLLRRQRLPWTAELPLEALRLATYPKVVLSGGSDAMYEAIASRLAEALGARRELLPYASHRVQDAPAFNAVIEQLVAAA